MTTRSGVASAAAYSTRNIGIAWCAPMWIDRWLVTWKAPRARPPCAICRGLGFIAAEFHYALAGDQESRDRHEDILQRANELRDLREELNR
eukprot:948856-Pyramimonas_sp.AAC.1